MSSNVGGADASVNFNAPMTEKKYYECFKRFAKNSPDGYRNALAIEFQKSGRVTEKVAMLRAAFDMQAPNTMQYFAAAIAEGSEDLANFALVYLSKKSVVKPEIAEMLAGLVWSDALASKPGLRFRAAAVMFASIDPAKLPWMARNLYSENDVGFVTTAAGGIRRNRSENANAIFAELAATHPSAEVRRALVDPEPVLPEEE